MEALTDLHKELINLFTYYAELKGSLDHWHETLKSRAHYLPASDTFLYVSQANPNEANPNYLYRKTFEVAIRDSSEDGALVTTH